MIRKLRENDLAQVANLESKTSAAPWSVDIFKDCLKAGYPGWVMEQEAEVVSFTIIAIHGDECHLLNLCVHPQFQRLGYGRQMLEYAVSSAKHLGAMMIYLEVRQTNTRAINLYKTSGFMQIGVRKEYYPGLVEREDAFVFARDLGLEKSL